jgi:hypothetical protein
MEPIRYFTSHGTGSRWGPQAVDRRAAPLRHQHEPAATVAVGSDMAAFLQEVWAWDRQVRALLAKRDGQQQQQQRRSRYETRG